MVDKYTEAESKLDLGEPATWAQFVTQQLGVQEAELHERMALGVQAIVHEIEAHGSVTDRAYLQQVLNEPAAPHEEGREGAMLSYFVDHHSSTGYDVTVMFWV